MLSHASISVQPASHPALTRCLLVSNDEVTLDVLSCHMLRSIPPQHVLLEFAYPKINYRRRGTDVFCFQFTIAAVPYLSLLYYQHGKHCHVANGSRAH